ncbi:sugar O-acyltransferase (sialic acid O-acetyltransferase NeuD family) [Algoriphagus sp. 4150]|uniref:DapH/DapD/GlmU-related protein n=1 Tax=Algoriphagus sp. 4150 TaxID=2817756 RepID=UPI002854E3CC|nr:DapH/DapD/GlmU-related protein [Algoriphagus sp. 4150]MDR7130523.1 sugar O-acyltransferase (sialic acid O-acetyltransferase NeuD family) [Algoriphagus sp. 4150]
MIIAGAGGHSLEVKAELIGMGFKPENLFVFDEAMEKSDFDENLFLKSGTGISLSSLFLQDPQFVLGVGNPLIRKKFYNRLTSLGGRNFSILSNSAQLEITGESDFDVFSYCFIGPNVKIGKGSLINTRANIHHECELGEFCEIGPSAVLLGAVKIGNNCRIGAGAVVLPGVNLGDGVVVGAGAVVTKNFSSGSKVKGIPATQFSL